MPQARFKYFVTCVRGLEKVLATELRSKDIGARQVKVGSSGVHFTGTLETGYRANLWLRTGIRVLAELAREKVDGPDALYVWARTVDWSRYLRLKHTFSVEGRVWDSRITHSLYAALRVKDAICDVFRERTGKRPNVDADHADVPLFLYLYRNEAVLYRDLSGTTLHKRGYRDALHKSSLNEALAAGCLLLSGWDGKSPLVDPMCGSGTFVIEAALLSMRRAPGLMRKSFPFQRWPDFDRALWDRCRDKASSRALSAAPCVIGANDHHSGALSLARKDAASAGVHKWISFSQSDVADYTPLATPSVVIANPPWGERLSPPDLAETYRKFSSFLKTKCAGASAWILSGSRDATKHLRLRASRKFPLRYGKVDCRLLKYEIRGRNEGRS